MAQLFAQQDRQPDVWVMSGAPTATVVYLSLQTTINYSSGSPDTLPANTPAVIYGTSDTAFDRSLDVWVPLTVRGSNVLSIIKESLLATITADYVAMARVELHGIKPYQPEPYLAAGGLGNQQAQTVVGVLSDTSARALSLWGGSANSAPPATWDTSGFDDSAWAHAVLATVQAGQSEPAGALGIWSSTLPLASTERVLFRQGFSLPAGTIRGATLSWTTDDELLAASVNGTALSGVSGFGGSASVPPSALLAGQANVLATEGGNLLPNKANNAYRLEVTYAGAGDVLLDPGGHEGDLLYYHAGAWVDLSIGSSGTVLASDGTDPGWATPTAGMSNPMTTSQDLIVGGSGGTPGRLGVGSNGTVLTVTSGTVGWAAASSGTVTSVALSAPGTFTVSGSPVTSSGTITLAWASQTANQVLAAPNGSSGAPSFRALVAADIPSLPASQITSGQLAVARGGTGVDGSSASNGALLIGNGSGYTLATLVAGSGVTITDGAGSISIAASSGSGTVTSVALSVPGIFSVSGSPITTSGTLAVTLATQSAGAVFAGPTSGSAAAPTFRALVASDLPAAAAAGGHIHAHGHFL